jgi:hypothetical protein
MANRAGPKSGHYGQARANQLDHSERLQSGVPAFAPGGDSRPTPKVRAVGESVQEAGRAVTAAAATDIWTLAGHGFAVGDRVKATALTGGAGIVAGQNYYVSQVIDANTFTVSATPPNIFGSPQDASVVAATDLFTTANHGLVAGTPIGFERLQTGGSGTPTAPLVGVIYYVIAAGLTANDFKVSTTRGGATIDVNIDIATARWRTVGAAPLDITSDLTAGTLTRYKTHQAGAHVIGGPDDTLPSVPGPRKGARVS